jgi:hypothetical protein
MIYTINQSEPIIRALEKIIDYQKAECVKDVCNGIFIFGCEFSEKVHF